jgi:hypothetical protein
MERIVVHALYDLEGSDRFAGISGFVNVSRHATLYSEKRELASSFVSVATALWAVLVWNKQMEGRASVSSSQMDATGASLEESANGPNSRGRTERKMPENVQY